LRSVELPKAGPSSLSNKVSRVCPRQIWRKLAENAVGFVRIEPPFEDFAKRCLICLELRESKSAIANGPR